MLLYGSNGIWFQRTEDFKAEICRINIQDVDVYRCRLYETTWPYACVYEGVAPTLAESKRQALGIMYPDEY